MARVYRLPWPALGQVHSALARRLGLAASPHRKLEVVRRRVLVLPVGLESLGPRGSREQSSLEVGATRSPLGRRSLPRPARPCCRIRATQNRSPTFQLPKAQGASREQALGSSGANGVRPASGRRPARYPRAGLL